MTKLDTMPIDADRRAAWRSRLGDHRHARKNRWLDRGSSAYALRAVMMILLERSDDRHVPMHELVRSRRASDMTGIDTGAPQEEGCTPAAMPRTGLRPAHHHHDQAIAGSFVARPKRRGSGSLLESSRSGP